MAGVRGARKQGVLRNVHHFWQGRRFGVGRRHGEDLGPEDRGVSAHLLRARLPRGRCHLLGLVRAPMVAILAEHRVGQAEQFLILVCLFFVVSCHVMSCPSGRERRFRVLT